MASLVTTTVAGTLTVNPDADSALEIVNGGTNAIVLRAKTGDELYVGSNGANAVRFPSAGGIDVTGTGTFSGALTATTIATTTTGSTFTDRIKIINGSAQLNIGQWDGANHRIEADANRPLMITSYQGNINLGTSGSTKLNVNSSGIAVTGTGTFSSSVNINAQTAININADCAGNVGYAAQYFNLDNSTNDATGHIRLARTAGTAFLGMEIAADAKHGIRFLTTDGGTLTERLKIDQNGNSTFSGALTVGSTTFANSTRELKWPNTSGQAASRSWGWVAEQGAYGYYQLYRSDASDGTLDTEVMRFRNTGNAEFRNDLLVDGALTFGGTLTGNSGDLTISNTAVNSDIIIKGERTAGTVTALTFDIADGGAATFSSKIQTAHLTLENTQISQTTGNLTLDVAGDINLDSDNGYFYLQDGGTSAGLFKLTSSNFYIKSTVADKDLIFQGNDGGSTVTALTLDMSDAGTAIFNHDIKLAALPSTTVNAAVPILFRPTEGTLSGDTALTWNPAADSLDVNGTVITSNHIRSSGTNSMKLGSANGGIIMYLTATSKVGIGTDDPLEKLTLNGGTGDGATYDVAQRFQRTSSTGNVLASKIVFDDQDTNWGDLKFKMKTTASAGESGSFWTDALTIEGRYGNVGIGNTAPAFPLDVVGSIQASEGSVLIAQADFGSAFLITSRNPNPALLGGSRFFQALTYNSAATATVARTQLTHDSAGVFSLRHDASSAGDPPARLSIKADGNVGIGTTVPIKLLHVKKSINSDFITSFHNTNAAGWGTFMQGGGDSSDYSLLIRNFASSDLFSIMGDGEIRVAGQTLVDSSQTNYNMIFPNMGGIAMGSAYTYANIYGSGGDIYLKANAYPANLGATSKIYFVTANSSGGQAGDVVVNNGQLGIGSAAPGAALDVAGAVHISPDTVGANTLRFTTNAANDGRILIKSGSTDKVDIQANGDSYFTGGRVGIGTNSPDSKLEIAGGGYNSSLKIKGSGAATGIQFEDSDGNTDGYVYAAGLSVGLLDAGADWTIQCKNDDYIRFCTNGSTEHMRINSAGTVNIGSPNTSSSILSAYESTDHHNAAGKPSSTINVGAFCLAANEGPTIDFNLRWNGGYEATNTTTGWIGGRIGSVHDTSSSNGGALVFYTNHGTSASGGPNSSQVTEKVRINPAGKVGIGITAPGQLLHVRKDQNTDTLLEIQNNTAGTAARAGLYLVSNSNNAIIAVADDGYTPVADWADTLFLNSNSGAGIRFACDSATKMTILADGNVGIGTAAPAKLLTLQSTTTPVLGFYSTYTDTNARNWAIQTNNLAYGDLTFSTSAARLGDPTVIKMSILKDGCVGIGTHTPGGRLAIRTTANEKSLWIAPSAATTANVFHMECDSLTTGSAIYVHSNTSNSSARNLVYINNDHSSATGTTCLYINQDSTGTAIKINKTNVASGGDFDFVQMYYSGSWGSNLGGIAAISASDGNGTIGRYGIAYASGGGRFVVTDLYDGGYGASGDVFYVKGDGNAYIQGTLTAAGFSGNGASISALNALNISNGTVGTARLGSGTANSSTFLAGNNTWATPSNTTYSAGTGLTLSSTTFSTKLDELTDMTADVVGSQDELILLDNGSDRRKQINEIKLGQFNNDQAWTSNAGDITSVEAALGLSGGGTSGAVSLALDLNELVDSNKIAAGDKVAFVDVNASSQSAICEVSDIPLSVFDNDSGWITSNWQALPNISSLTALP